MAKTITTSGKTPFEVTIAQTVPGMVRFVRAMSRTQAIISSQRVKVGGPFVFIVWLNPVMIGTFKAFCEPLEIQFISSGVIRDDGTVELEKISKR